MATAIEIGMAAIAGTAGIDDPLDLGADVLCGTTSSQPERTNAADDYRDQTH